MSKARSMYAGSSGYNYSVNKNSPGNGNGKWQGLWPSVGHARNARHINIEAGGNNRNVVFCMNQLGGVGRISNMFATTADGVKKPCPGAAPWWFNNPAILFALQAVGNYVLTNTTYNADPNNPLVYVAFIGDAESLKTDHIKNQTGYDPNDPSWLFELLEPTTTSSSVNNAIKLLNSMKLQFTVNGKIQTHVVGIVGEKAIMALENAGYGFRFFLGDNLASRAFGGPLPSCLGVTCANLSTFPKDVQKTMCEEFWSETGARRSTTGIQTLNPSYGGGEFLGAGTCRTCQTCDKHAVS